MLHSGSSADSLLEITSNLYDSNPLGSFVWLYSWLFVDALDDLRPICLSTKSKPMEDRNTVDCLILAISDKSTGEKKCGVCLLKIQGNPVATNPCVCVGDLTSNVKKHHSLSHCAILRAIAAFPSYIHRMHRNRDQGGESHQRSHILWSPTENQEISLFLKDWGVNRYSSFSTSFNDFLHSRCYVQASDSFGYYVKRWLGKILKKYRIGLVFIAVCTRHSPV